ncbi:MAG: tRNA dihydrouridine synthase DusB, partial [Gammaproteobacteria bacterium]
DWMASSARYNVNNGAQIIDINMGCPAKKVCNKQAGSALLRDEKLVGKILDAIVRAIDIPVTLKIRTGWSPEEKNATTIARIAEDSGISALTIHGRTRACAFKGDAEYDTIAEVKTLVSIPVIANGDIDSAQKAIEVLAYTKADGVMIGRAAQGNPWLLQQINQGLNGQKIASTPPLSQVGSVMIRHLKRLHAFYGENAGVRIARKHLGWYCNRLPEGQLLRETLMHAKCASEQFDLLNGYFDKYDNRLLIAA